MNLLASLRYLVALLSTVRTPDGKPLPVMGEAVQGARLASR